MLKKKLTQSSKTNEYGDEASSESGSAKKSKFAVKYENEATISHHFTNSQNPSFENQFIDIQLRLNSRLKDLKFEPKVGYVYNPVEYAYKCNESYIKKYCPGTKKIVFVGMNPGPFGMCQTGVPFGEIKSVRDWLKIQEIVEKPDPECPKRPVLGFDCKRTEVSGDRFWNLIKKLFETPEKFFRNAFVYNYCPLALLKADGCNLTPSEIEDNIQLEEICDESYYEILGLLKPDIVVGIGVYVEKRTTRVLKKNQNSNIKVLRLPHPSPRAINNQNWLEKAETFFNDNDLISIITQQ